MTVRVGKEKATWARICRVDVRAYKKQDKLPYSANGFFHGRLPLSGGGDMGNVSYSPSN